MAKNKLLVSIGQHWSAFWSALLVHRPVYIVCTLACSVCGMQVLQGFQGEVLLGGAACLARQGFLDTAQDLLSQHRAAVGKTDLPALQAQLRLRIAQVTPHSIIPPLQNHWKSPYPLHVSFLYIPPSPRAVGVPSPAKAYRVQHSLLWQGFLTGWALWCWRLQVQDEPCHHVVVQGGEVWRLEPFVSCVCQSLRRVDRYLKPCIGLCLQRQP